MSEDNLIGDPETETAIRHMEVEAVNFATRFIQDAAVRADYMQKTKEMATELSLAYKRGQISAYDAASAAVQMRNEIMEFARIKSSDIGKAKAKAMKAKGLDLQQLMNKYASKKYAKLFSELSEAEKNVVLLEIVSSSGRANPRVNARAARMRGIGRGLWVLTACLAIYNVSTAENKLDAAGREAANIGGGFAGGAGGGAIAGIWFGPIGVAIGVVIGGTLGAIASDQIYVEISGPDGTFARTFIPRFTSVFGVDEDGMAKALINEVRYETKKVLSIFQQLNDKYTTDADDIALRYVKLLMRSPGPARVAVKHDIGLRNYLVSVLDDGWTSSDEEYCIRYLRAM